MKRLLLGCKTKLDLESPVPDCLNGPDAARFLQRWMAMPNYFGLLKWGGANLYFAAVLALSLLFVSSTSAALNETYYVDKTSAAPSLGTQADPFHSIKEATDIVEQGDTVIVAGGSEAAPTLYAERISFETNPNSGAAGARITVRAEPRRSVVMYGFETNDTDYLTIQGFQITIPDSLIQADPKAKYALLINSDDVEIRDNYFFDVPGWAIRADHETPWHVRGLITGNHMFRCGVGISIYGDDWLVEDNEVERLVQSPSVGADADYSRAFGNNITFRANHFHGTQANEIGTSHVDGLQTFDNNGWYLHNLTFEDNIVTDFGQGVIMSSAFASGNISDVTIRNNVFDGGNLGGAYGILGMSGITNLSIVHNLFANMDIHGIYLRFGAEGTVMNNIFYNAGSNYQADDASSLVGGYNILNREGYPYYKDPNDIVNVDPLFIDPDNWLGPDGLPFTADDGYMLWSTSPAIDAGADVGVTTDILGNPRPETVEGAFDIGPFETLNPPHPPVVTVPDVVGLTQAAAEAAITGAGLAVGSIETQYHAAVAAGSVISQNPASGASEPLGSSVDLVVSLGPPPVTVPDVVGLTQEAAEAAIADVNLTVDGITTQYDPAVPAGSVISQDPAGGSSAPLGSSVDLVVSLGPDPALEQSVPDVTGLSQAAAESAIVAAGLTVGDITTQYDAAVPVGGIISQNPVGLAYAPLGSSVDLVVSLGPPPAQANAGGGGGGCFIATAAYGTPFAEEIDVLRVLRDHHLLRGALGTAFVDTYYRLSPPIANIVASNRELHAGVRLLLVPVIVLTRLVLQMPLVAAMLMAFVALSAGLRAVGPRRRVVQGTWSKGLLVRRGPQSKRRRRTQ